MRLDPAQLPGDIATLKAMLVAERAARAASGSRAETAEAHALDLDAEIANLKLTIAKIQREMFGASSERSSLISSSCSSPSSWRRKPRTRPRPRLRRPLPRGLRAASQREDHYQRTSRASASCIPHPTICPCCSGTRFRKLGEDAMETLERVPAH